jgi:hypothetical protein
LNWPKGQTHIGFASPALFSARHDIPAVLDFLRVSLDGAFDFFLEPSHLFTESLEGGGCEQLKNLGVTNDDIPTGLRLKLGPRPTFPEWVWGGYSSWLAWLDMFAIGILLSWLQRRVYMGASGVYDADGDDIIGPTPGFIDGRTKVV